MYKWEKTTRDGGFVQEKGIPSFSSSLLDKIYRSIDEGEVNQAREPKFYTHSVGGLGKKQSKCSVMKAGEAEVFGRIESVRAGPWVEKRGKESEFAQRRLARPETEKKPRRNREFDHDALFSSSGSSSSDSSSNGFSSSDTESVYGGMKIRTSCFAPPRPKPVRTSVSERSDKTGAKTEHAMFHEQRNSQVFDEGEGIIKSKSRALKIYSNLKKVKQPISPGGKLANFINSLFAANNNARKPKQSLMPVVPYAEEESASGKLKSGDSSACSSASSFSRSCLSKHSPATREKLREGAKRTVRFYPVSVILDEDCRPCGHKSLCQEDEKEGSDNTILAARKSGMNMYKNNVEEIKYNRLMERTCQVEEAAREFLRNYRRNQKRKEDTTNVTMMMTSRNGRRGDDDDKDYDDDTASCSSSDLFELDHLAAVGNHMYYEELPVYETTHVGTNRAIASGLIM